jgi:hypothetical protein
MGVPGNDEEDGFSVAPGVYLTFSLSIGWLFPYEWESHCAFLSRVGLK